MKARGPETFALYMVEWPGYEACQAEGPGAFKRWECSLPFAPFGPVRFSEKIQRFTPFSLGFEFLPGETYYYISVPTPVSSGQCLRLQVSVCCKESKSESAHPVGSPGGDGEGGVLPAPSVSCCCCCSQFCGSCKFSEPSRPFCHPQELESSQDSLEEPLPPELGVPSQTRWESDGGGGGRGDPHGWPPSG